MKRKIPAWAIVIGILLLLFGGCSIKNSVQLVMTPTILETQKNFFKSIPALQKQAMDSVQLVVSDSVKQSGMNKIPFAFLGKSMEEMFSISAYTQRWMVRLGYIGFFVSVLYILAGIFLLVINRYSLPVIYVSIGICIVFGIIKAVILTNGDSGFLSVITGLSQIFGIFLDLVLLILILVFNKAAYRFNTDAKLPGLVNESIRSN